MSTRSHPNTIGAEVRELIEDLREPDSHDPACPFSRHCYCDDGAPHDNVSDEVKLRAADALESLISDRVKLREALEEAGALLDELLNGPSKGTVYGAGDGSVLRGKLMTIQMTLNTTKGQSNGE